MLINLYSDEEGNKPIRYMNMILVEDKKNPMKDVQYILKCLGDHHLVELSIGHGRGIRFHFPCDRNGLEEL